MKEENFFSDFNMNIPAYALDVMQRMNDFGEEIYIVGGSVRDVLLGKTPNDYDMATSAFPEKTLELFSDYRVIETGVKHGTLTLICDSNPIELTTFRIDGEYTDSRRPDSVMFTRSLYKDLARRDFTVNAMAYSPSMGLADPFGGRFDLKLKLIRAVGEPERRFCEDALRIMRAFRFCAVLGFDIEEKTLYAARKCKERLSLISRERIGAELSRLICAPYAQKALTLMLELGIFPYVFGSASPNSDSIELALKMPQSYAARLGVLLAKESREVISHTLELLRCSNEQKKTVFAIAEASKICVASSEDARRFRASFGKNAAIAIRASVLFGRSADTAPKLVEGDNSPTKICELAVGGKELGELGLEGRELGLMLEYLLDRVIENPEFNTKDMLIQLAKERQRLE